MEILLLLIAHFIGDFLFQSSKIAHLKMDQFKYYLLHCAIYSGVIALPLLCFGPFKNVMILFIVITVTHAIIDYSRIKILKNMKTKKKMKMKTLKTDYNSMDFSVFVLDQFLHLSVIVVSAHFIYEQSFIGDTIKTILLKHLEWQQVHNILVYVLLYIICLSPTAILIKKVFVFFSIQVESDHDKREELINSGYIIGILERMIILTLGLNGQLGAIGFVVAAKSLARFKQLEDKNFAEKYLLGTLLSVTISLFCITIGNFLLIQ